MAQKRRSLLVLPLIVLVCSIAGGFYGPQVQAEAADPSDTAELDQDVASFTKVLALVEQNFAEPVSADKAIYKGAIPGMLRTLDPHSNFFDPKDYKELREDQRGRYSGVGMQVQARNGKTVVQAPFPGYPAYKAGLRPGDIIVMVDDKPTDGLNTTEIADLLKGDRRNQGQDRGLARRFGRQPHLHGHARRHQPQERGGCLLGKAGDRLRQDPELRRNHRQGPGRQPEALGREQYQGTGAGPSQQPRRVAEPGRGRGRPFPRERGADCLAPWPFVAREVVCGAQREPWARISHRGVGGRVLGLRGGDCGRRAAGPRPRLDSGRPGPSARAWCRRSTRSAKTPAWR